MEQQLQNGQYPPEVFLKKWSWGGFLIAPFWALGSRLVIPGVLLLIVSYFPEILLFVPGLPLGKGIFVLVAVQGITRLILIGFGIYFGLKGRQKSWAAGKWESFDVFRKRQKFLDNLGFILFLIIVIAAVVFPS